MCFTGSARDFHCLSFHCILYYQGPLAEQGTPTSDCPANTLSANSAGSFLNDLAGTPAILLLAELGQIGDSFSEDCLTLNIWTKPQVGETKKGWYKR